MKCTICDGLGFLYERDAAGDRYEVDCQTCGATGRVIDPDALERIATALERIANRLDSITSPTPLSASPPGSTTACPWKTSRAVRAAGLTLDRASRRLLVEGRRVDLTPSEFDLLAALMASPGRVFTRAELLDRVQGMAYEGYERTIDVHVRNLRAKIEPEPKSPRYIETVFGVGYRFSDE